MVYSSTENEVVEEMREYVEAPGQSDTVLRMKRKLWKRKLTKFYAAAGLTRSEQQGATVAARRGARARCCAPRVEI